VKKYCWRGHNERTMWIACKSRGHVTYRKPWHCQTLKPNAHMVSVKKIDNNDECFLQDESPVPMWRQCLVFRVCLTPGIVHLQYTVRITRSRQINSRQLLSTDHCTRTHIDWLTDWRRAQSWAAYNYMMMIVRQPVI